VYVGIIHDLDDEDDDSVNDDPDAMFRRPRAAQSTTATATLYTNAAAHSRGRENIPKEDDVMAIGGHRVVAMELEKD